MSKKGLVLEGGGAKGAFHCGAVMALYDNGYRFDGVAGTSIGAINAALIVQDSGYASLLRLWENVHASMFTDFDDEQVENLLNKHLTKDTVAYWSKQVLRIIKNLGIPTEKIIPFLQQNISEKRVRSSSIDLAVVTYSLSDRKPIEIFKDDIPLGEMLNYLLASAYYPAFRLKKINGKLYIDGGVYDNMPVALMAQKGFDDIIAVRTMSRMPHKNSVSKDVAVHYICPSEDLGGTASISHEDINRKIKLGYYDALRFIKGYSGKYYYIDGDIAGVINKAVTILHTFAMRICKEVTIKTKDKSKTSYQDKVFGFLQNCYKTDIESSIWSFIEEYAQRSGLEKFYIYDKQRFMDSLKEKGSIYAKKLKDQKYKGKGSRVATIKDTIFLYYIREVV
ncbi:MAG: patatin-like phospholipase family protein [Clostridia bacterium]|nr:patatin-like phospholipase family protein [Clostridia bacterium]